MGSPAAQAAAESQASTAYAFAPDAEAVEGAASSADAPKLEAGGTYTDQLERGETLHYAVDLDEGSSAYLTTVVVPRLGSEISASDGVEVELLTTDNETCSDADRSFGTGSNAPPRPITVWAGRVVAQGADCQRAGTYVYTVTRVDGTDRAEWPIELRFAQEPRLSQLPESAPPVDSWETEQPAPPGGEAVRVPGGTGFNDAQPIGEGVWRDDLEAGTTRAYRVPLDWGQQLALTLDLGNAADVDEYSMAYGHVRAELYNPAAGRIGDPISENYYGEQLSIEALTAGVHYGNRFEDTDGVDEMAFAGWYYLLVTLSPDVADITDEPVGATLRLSVLGDAQPGPSYASDPVEAGFGVTEAMVSQAAKGQTDEEVAAERASDDKRLRGYVSVGVGLVLALCLGAWYLVGRRRALAAAGPAPWG
ncbi:hypothetical protein [Streptomyces sedi]|uniref:Uncharacterized protein n=1 Tax=Streptomyces sedi TaxID=555059 RepID=A0A5C4V357_9ACTN|nr:hypothetical protein [Streptomyces sedi]TNM30183.1 hypothetical protein FH715_12515 [Streptomyces sedi]